MSKKHPQKKETLILTFSEPFFGIVAVFVLKMALVFCVNQEICPT